MRSRTRIAAALLLALSFTSPASAQEPIKFARTPDISPDGKLIAFSYLGDIWTVEAIGGVARPVTMHEAHDVNPVFSPDGKWLAFSSNRHGQYDVFVAPAVGGRPRRLTFDSAPDMVTGWSPDGKAVVFSSSRGTEFPANLNCYTVPFDGGTETKLPLFEGKEAHLSPVGGYVAFVRGPGTWYRRGYRGSSNDDIWVGNLDGTSQKQLTTFDGQDGSPMWAPDGRKMYYVTEQGSKPGCANIVAQNLGPGGVAEGGYLRLTTHDDDTVRRARVSANGEWIVYECGADLWVVGTRLGSAPRKLAIEVNADDKSNTERSVTFTRDATEFALHPEETAAVVTVQGELFLVKLPDGGKATRLTESPAFDHAASFSPDGRTVVFLSDRTGQEEIYLLEADDPEHSEFTRAHKFKVKRLTTSVEGELGPTFSPKGDRIAFLRSGKLWTMKPDGTDQKVLVNETQVFDYDWSPDGSMVVFARMDGSFASELYIVPTDGSSPPKNITRYATYNADVSWSKTGNRVGFIGQRRGLYAPCVLNLQKPGTPGAAGEIDWDDIHLRVDRAAGMAAESVAISPNGSQIAFRHTNSGDDLWVANSNGSSVTRVTTSGQAPKYMRWSRKSSGLIYFLNGSGELRSVRAPGTFASLVGGSVATEPNRVGFQAKMTVRRDEEFAEMFVQCWRALSDSFYDSKHHGADWASVRSRFQPLVGHVAQREDLYALVSLMLGELNASHLGISGKLPTPDEWTADLGLIFDDSYRGPGLKVAEVLKHGPADKRGLNIKPGDVVLSIDRVDLTAKVNVSQLLNNKTGEGVLLDVTSDVKDPKAKRRVEVIGASRDRVSQLMYERWVRQNADAVSKASGGKLGYIHIPSMDDAGLEVFVRSLYSDHFDKDAVVIDVRYNGGGFTHDQVLNYLSGKEHTFFRQRDGGEGLVLRSYDRKWTKPVVVMANNRSYSDAEIFPHAFRALGLGKVVGQATGGFVIGTTSTRLIDGSTFRLPRTGVFTNKGVNMEKQGVVPDVAVEITPDDWARGRDTQLLKAVEVVSDDVRDWKAKKTGIAAGGPAPAPVPPPTPVGNNSGAAPRTPPTPAPMPKGITAPGTPREPEGRIPLAE
ncbi:peptidase s41 : Peptidase S41 OS=Caldithrix abyssi DSM 13497 GN=Calab_3076 PE=4 SV=1: PD40: PD40: PD40: PD40: PD40: PD40: Tricorn_C1: Tricorn_PDZ: Peptidase_S41 [Gemmataceae bacterium]|nr:peptidase s41 : Peptidase S41 OS=Caldithrix abyssi DSM 13497 GN=Calab_3076 PE=4 SV=1: PD40: PD40: PD40: PD40: PD40: PD40: Tricorn_C1: Tricorn_PDZ: Peptidase_S41 [Gemmataceae bacterium]VTU01510.1 peptidase s41 : Peptidase S41 OS=Caldithrix abyssi DSM 13497 GN=Calab_3076 PE=4 SV=1: PD40: PD40: PD40: PD40: PD40: PD40: Tricorn_C1: Tricorn_PDZ: Peptidase_S41 [Gemmataceae bacterium]